MIRPATPEDADRLVEIAVEAGLFPAEEAGFLNEMLAEHFAGDGEDGHVWLADELDGRPCAVAFYQPAEATNGTWYVKMLTVAPDSQRGGRGTAMMRHVEDALRSDGQRVLLVETSSLDEQAPARAFYAKGGYDEVARVPDYYDEGDDMVLYRKSLRTA